MRPLSERDWNAAASVGELLVRQRAAKLPTQTADDMQRIMAYAFGVITEGARLLRTLSGEGGASVSEQNALACVRGAIRGAAYPVTDAGTRFPGAPDA